VYLVPLIFLSATVAGDVVGVAVGVAVGVVGLDHGQFPQFHLFDVISIPV
jgi:hypothetical protein